jgi:large subunit ribosomal protein L10e
MAVHRKASAYSKRRAVINTRHSRKQKYNYVSSVPHQKIVKFNMGDISGFEQGVYKIKATILTIENIQIRDFALEAVRQDLNRSWLEIFQKSFFLKCNVFPHNVIRNNRVFSGGSKGERVQMGMSLSFGKPEGRAATVKAGRPIFTTYFNGEANLPKVKDAFRKTIPKLPCKTKILIEQINGPAKMPEEAKTKNPA